MTRNRDSICFNVPYTTGAELRNVSQALTSKHLAGDGEFSRLCSNWLEENFNIKRALLTHSCTAALEMAAILIEAGPDDEIIMPSYTFVSTANAFVLRGATPVFVDIEPTNLNIDPRKVEKAVTDRTKAIVVVHYAGVSCDMTEIMAIAKRHDLVVIEDAAQAFMSKHKDRWLGSIGDIGTFSFHETKNIVSGEGGALLLNSTKYIKRAEIIREKGTDRAEFLMGGVDKYTWRDIGSSYLPSEIIAAFLWAQIESSSEIIAKRKALWDKYLEEFSCRDTAKAVQLPKVNNSINHNGHIFYVLLPNGVDQAKVIDFMKKKNISTPFHYIPLHSSPAGKRFCKVSGSMKVTNDISSRIVRLPLWVGMSYGEQEFVVSNLLETVYSLKKTYEEIKLQRKPLKSGQML